MLPTIASFFLSFPYFFGYQVPVKPVVVVSPPPAVIITTPRPIATVMPTPSIKPTPSISPSPKPSPRVIVISTPRPTQNTIVITSQSLFKALNDYRAKNGKGSLAWDDKLGNYAQERANAFKASGNIDNHAGFSSFIQNQNGFATLGFNSLGENSSHGGMTSSQDIIEKIYANSPNHNQNMLGDWSHVGVGVAGEFTNFIFGGKKR